MRAEDEKGAAMGRTGSKSLPGRNRGVGKHPDRDRLAESRH